MWNKNGLNKPSPIKLITHTQLVLFQDIHDSCEPAMFSLEQLLFSVALDIRTNVEILETVLPMLKEVYDREIKGRAEVQVNAPC